MTRQLTEAIQKLEDELAKAEKTGDKAAIAKATEALEARKRWLTRSRRLTRPLRVARRILHRPHRVRALGGARVRAQCRHVLALPVLRG